MENRKIKRVFRSRISVFIIVFILGIFIMAAIPIFQRGICQGMNSLVPAFVFFVFLFCGMRYIISGDKLYLKIWMIPSGSVSIADIISIERSYKQPISSPAASFKRLRIDLTGVKFGLKGAKFPYLLISPIREREFIEALKAVNPDIIVQVSVKNRVWRVQDWDV
jgi:uncharacterized membrane protein YdfJ with MMPL/SSD domain